MAHPFEERGLGKAPFRYLGCFEQRGNACHYCGTGIRYCYQVAGADSDNVFIVGSECIKKTTDSVLLTAVKEEEKVRSKDKRREKKAEQQKLKAIERAKYERELRRRRRTERHDTLNKDLIGRAFAARHIPLIRNIITQALWYGSMTDKQADAIENILAQQTITNEWLGEEGEMINFTAKKIHAIHYESRFGSGTISVLRTPEGHILKTFGNCPIKKGEMGNLRAKVKEHSQYQGRKETLLTYLKLVDQA